MLNAVRMPSRGFIEYNTHITLKHREKNFGPTFQVQLLAPWLLCNILVYVCTMKFLLCDAQDWVEQWLHKILNINCDVTNIAQSPK